MGGTCLTPFREGMPPSFGPCQHGGDMLTLGFRWLTPTTNNRNGCLEVIYTNLVKIALKEVKNFPPSLLVYPQKGATSNPPLLRKG